VKATAQRLPAPIVAAVVILGLAIAGCGEKSEPAVHPPTTAPTTVSVPTATTPPPTTTQPAPTPTAPVPKTTP